MGTPKGPSNSQIKSDAMVEEERVRFEADRRNFLERVASYDIASEGQRRMDGGSLEYIDPSFKDPNDFGIAGLSIPGKFDPSLDFSKFDTRRGPDLSWAQTPSLGFTPDWAIDWHQYNKQQAARNDKGFFGNVFGHALNTLIPRTANPWEHARDTARLPHSTNRGPLG